MPAAQSVSPVRVSESFGDGADVAADDLLDLGVLLALDEIQVAELLTAARARVCKRHIRGDLAGDHLKEGEFSVLVGDGLEDEQAGLSVGIDGDLALRRLFRLGVEGGRRVVDKPLKQVEGAEALEGGAAEDRGERKVLYALADAGKQLLLGKGLAAEELLHQLLGGLGHVLGEQGVILLDPVVHLGRDGHLYAFAAVELIGFFMRDVDGAGELSALERRNGERAERDAEGVAETLEGAEKVGVLLVELADVEKLGQPAL